jgi:hypothetical protein
MRHLFGTTFSASSIRYLLNWPKVRNFTHDEIQVPEKFGPITRERIEIFSFWKKI